MQTHSALGRGLGSLIPQKKSMTEQVIPSAKTEIVEIPVADVVANPRQPRIVFNDEDLADLKTSIALHGLLQPIVVTRHNGSYELIAGERRLRASRAIGLLHIPAIVREASDQVKLELALIENIQRQDLNAVEEAIAYKALVEEFGLTQEEVGKRVGKSRSNVANMLRLLDLDEHMLKALKEGRLTKTHARTLLAELDLVKREQLFEAMLSGKVSVQEAEARVQEGRTIVKKMTFSKDPNIASHEKKLREVWDTKVTIQEQAGRGKIILHFYSREEFVALLERLNHA